MNDVDFVVGLKVKVAVAAGCGLRAHGVRSLHVRAIDADERLGKFIGSPAAFPCLAPPPHREAIHPTRSRALSHDGAEPQAGPGVPILDYDLTKQVTAWKRPGHFIALRMRWRYAGKLH
jgi:hypothetical protein